MSHVHAPHDASQAAYQDMVRAERIISQQAPANQDAARWLYAQPANGNRFIASLAAQLDRQGSLSPRQWECARDNAARAMQPRQARKSGDPRQDRANAAERQAPLPDVPEGHYATASRTGNNDLDFWRVDRPTEGKWAGYTFVKRILGGHPDPTRVTRAEQRQALEAIVAAGIDAAGTLYGTELGQCRKCNRSLTDETSRRLGIGPDCRQAQA